MRRARRGMAAVFAWPALLGVVSVAGLAAGLIGENGWDCIAWAGLAAPALAAVRAR